MHNSASTFYLIFAEFGERFTTPLTSFLKKRGLDLKNYIEKKFNIKSYNQIIVHKSGKLINDETLLEGFLKEKMKLFVFNKELHNNSQINLKRTQSLINELLGEPAKIKRDFFQEFSNKFKGQSLFNVLHVLADSFQEIQGLYNTALDERKLVKYLYKNIEFQKKGEKVVKNNCEKYFLQTKQEVNDNLEQLMKNNDIYKENLTKVDSLFERLKEYETLSCFQSKGIKTLQDFFKKENIDKWKNKFEKIQNQFDLKLGELKSLFDQYSLKDVLNNLQLNIELNKILGEDLKKIKDELEIVFFQHLNKLEEAKRDYKQFFETKKLFLKNLIEKLQKIKMTLQDSKEKNIESIQIFISKVSKLQEDIHLKMRNSLKILEHQDKQLAKESLFLSFISNFPNLYEDCLKEQERRVLFSMLMLKQNGSLLKIINFEKEKRHFFFKESLINEMEYCPRNFFPNLVGDDDAIEFYLNNMKTIFEKQIFDNGADLSSKIDILEDIGLEKTLTDNYLVEIEKLKEMISPLKNENDELLRKIDEQNFIIDKITLDLTGRNLEISTQINLNQELQNNLEHMINEKNEVTSRFDHFITTEMESFKNEKEALVKENENIKFLFESKKTFNEEELIKTIENMRNEMQKIASEKDNYKKSLFESNSQTNMKEDELNKTIDFFKIENAKLCDQILKLCNELKRKDDWIKTIKQINNRIAGYCEANLAKIKMNLDKKCVEFAERQTNLLKFIKGPLKEKMESRKTKIRLLHNELKFQKENGKFYESENLLLQKQLKENEDKVAINSFNLKQNDLLIFKYVEWKKNNMDYFALTKSAEINIICIGIPQQKPKNNGKPESSFVLGKILDFIEDAQIKDFYYQRLKKEDLEIILVRIEILQAIV